MYKGNFTFVSSLSNQGQARQQDIDYMLTGKIRKPDHVPFDVDSDIPEYGISVKSSRFTLVSAARVYGETFDEIWNEYARRVHSKWFCYATATGEAYFMNLEEFESFVRAFCTVERESSKNGGGLKIRCKKESKAMLTWLSAAQGGGLKSPQ